MPIASFEKIFEAVDQQAAPIPVVAIGGAEQTVLQALASAEKRGWIKPIITGSRSEIESVATQHSIDLQSFEIVDSGQPAFDAVQQIRNGNARLLMKGKVSTPDLMRAVLDREQGLRTDETICQVVLMQLPRQNRSIVLADTGICVSPDTEQRVEIIAAATRIARRLGAIKPRVALMAATESPTPAMPDSVESDEITKRFREGSPDNPKSVELADCLIQGPLSFDLAFDPSAAQRKQVEGPVVGNADVMIFPNLVAANLTVKAIMYTAECKFGGILCGARCPIVFMSRSDSTDTRLCSLALALKTLEPIRD